MDLYQKNPSTLRRLLAKRQSSTAQIFKPKSSNTTNLLKNPINLFDKVPNITLDFDIINEKLKASQNSRKQSVDQEDYILGQKFKKATPNSPIIIDLECDYCETIEKKMKPSLSEATTRRTSFDDEKEVSEHSTTCDNHSEIGLINHEAGDFIWSPTISTQANPAKDPIVLVLDEEEETPSRSEASFMFVKPNNDALIYAEAQSQAEMLGGNCLNKSLSNNKFKFMCKLRHQWEASLEEMNQRWCPKCASMLNKCRAFAQGKGGSCLAEKFDETISFQCHAGHVWNTSSRNYSSKWCAQCIVDEKDAFRKKCEEARAKREKAEEECQRKLFEEARRKAMGSQANQETSSKEEMLKYFQKVDAELEVLAKKEADNFMLEQGENVVVNYQQAMQVYKFLLMPDNILEKYMSNLTPEILKSEFRRMAKIIHPDKNKHPSSKLAFQKIYRVYEIMINRFEGNQKI